MKSAKRTDPEPEPKPKTTRHRRETARHGDSVLEPVPEHVLEPETLATVTAAPPVGLSAAPAEPAIRLPAGLEHWPIDRLRPYPANPRTHSPAQVARIVASMREFGCTPRSIRGVVVGRTWSHVK